MGAAKLEKRSPGLWLPGDPLPEDAEDSVVFRCPVCGNQFRQREPMEPACTGHSWRDEHELTVMVRVDSQSAGSGLPYGPISGGSGPTLFVHHRED